MAPVTPSFRTATAAYLALAALWVATRPYPGIVHDARLYAFQALHVLEPERFGDDLYVVFGSQDSFTIFSALYAPLIDWLGLALAHHLTLAVVQVGWLAALLWLTHALFRPRQLAVLAAAGVIALAPHYGAFGSFSYGEPFLTPRLLAEALTMVGIGAVLRQRVWIAAVSLGLALIVHPLMAVPGIALAILSMRPPVRVVVGPLAMLVAVSVVLAEWDLEPFRRLLLSFDDPWFELLRRRIPYALISEWDWGAIATLLMPCCVVILALGIGEPAERRLAGALLGVATLSLLISYGGGEVARNVLILNLQPWRALWLLSLLGNAWAIPILLRLPRGSRARQFLLIALVLNVLEYAVAFTPFASAATVAVSLALYFRERRNAAPLPRFLRLTVIAIADAAIVFVAFVLLVRIPILTEPVGPAGMFARLLVPLSSVSLIGFLYHRQRAAARWPVPLAGLLFLSALSVNDQRTDWARFVTAETMPDDLRTFLGQSRTVYWEQGLELLWLGLRRPSFYSCSQGTTAMFYRDAAMEYRRRGAALRRLDTGDFTDGNEGLCYPTERLDTQGAPSRAVLTKVCEDLPELDLIVLTRESPDSPYRTWQAPVALPLYRDGAWQRYTIFYGYACGIVTRSPSADPQSPTATP